VKTETSNTFIKAGEEFLFFKFSVLYSVLYYLFPFTLEKKLKTESCYLDVIVIILFK